MNKADLCASFQKTVTEILIENIKKIIANVVGTGLVSAKKANNKPIAKSVGVAPLGDPQDECRGGPCVHPKEINKLVLAGGVSANSYIRNEFSKLEKEENIKIYYPELKLCTDNAAMIASAGYYNYLEGNISDFTLNAVPNLKL